VEAEELKGEKGAGTLRRDRNFTNGDRLSASARHPYTQFWGRLLSDDVRAFLQLIAQNDIRTTGRDLMINMEALHQ